MKNSIKILSILSLSFLLNQSCSTEKYDEIEVYDLKGQNSKGSEIIIADDNFREVLFNTNCVDTNGDGIGDRNADLNGDGKIEKKEANAIEGLILQFKYETPISFADITGIEHFSNLKFLNIQGPGGYFYEHEVLNTKNLSYDLTGLRKLEYLQINGLGTEYYDNINCSGLNKLIEVNLSLNRPMDFYTDKDPFVTVNFEACSNLKKLNMTNSFLRIDFCQIPSLEVLDMFYLEGGEPDTFDFHCLENLKWLNIGENRISRLILKNSSVLETFKADGIGDGGINPYLPYVDYICIDDNPTEWEQISTLVGENTIVTTACSFD